MLEQDAYCMAVAFGFLPPQVNFVTDSRTFTEQELRARQDYLRPNVAGSTLERTRARSRTSFNELKGAPDFAGRIRSTTF